MPSTSILLPLVLALLFCSLLGVTASPLKIASTKHGHPKDVCPRLPETCFPPRVILDNISRFKKHTVDVDDPVEFRDSKRDDNGDVDVTRSDENGIKYVMKSGCWNNFPIAKDVRHPYENRQSGPVVDHWVSTMDARVEKPQKDSQLPPVSDHGVTNIDEKGEPDEKSGDSGAEEAKRKLEDMVMRSEGAGLGHSKTCSQMMAV